MSAWHAAPEHLVRFATAPESLDQLTASSLEAHLIGCDSCRRAVAAAAAPSALESSWLTVADRIDEPQRTLAERALGWFLPDHVARVVAATPALRWSWFVAVVAVVVAAVVAAAQAGSDTPFLAVAPLVPLAGVAVSFGAAPDPAGEAALVTPLYGAALLLRRAAAVLATSLVVLGAGSLALPGLEPRDAGWVLPALALTLATLALSTWLAPAAAAALIATGWLTTLQVVVVNAGSTARSIADSSLFAPPGQLAFAALAALGALAIASRRSRLSILEAS